MIESFGVVQVYGQGFQLSRYGINLCPVFPDQSAACRSYFFHALVELENWVSLFDRLSFLTMNHRHATNDVETQIRVQDRFSEAGDGQWLSLADKRQQKKDEYHNQISAGLP
jgi:hypothetical protein